MASLPVTTLATFWLYCGLFDDRHFSHFSRSTSEYARQGAQIWGELDRSTELFLDKYSPPTQEIDITIHHPPFTP